MGSQQAFVIYSLTLLPYDCTCVGNMGMASVLNMQRVIHSHGSSHEETDALTVEPFILDTVPIWSPNSNVHFDHTTQVRLMVEDPEVGNEVGEQHPAPWCSVAPARATYYTCTTKYVLHS